VTQRAVSKWLHPESGNQSPGSKYSGSRTQKPNEAISESRKQWTDDGTASEQLIIYVAEKRALWQSRFNWRTHTITAMILPHLSHVRLWH